MRRLLEPVAVLLLLSAGLEAGEKNPADYSLSAHVLGTAKHHTRGGTTSTYDAQTGQWSYGTYSGSINRETDIRIGNLIYTLNRVCKEIEVGKDYPAKVNRKKVSILLPDGKTCEGRIESTQEIPAPR